MAIIKDYETPQGVTANYHRLVKAEFDCNNDRVLLTVAVYASPDARVDGRDLLWMEYQQVPFSAFSGDPSSALYSLLTDYDGSYLAGGVPDEIASDEIPLDLADDAKTPEARSLTPPGRRIP
jgi:hypothetical protein